MLVWSLLQYGFAFGLEVEPFLRHGSRDRCARQIVFLEHFFAGSPFFRDLLGIADDRQPVSEVAVSKRVSTVGNTGLFADALPSVIKGIRDRPISSHPVVLDSGWNVFQSPGKGWQYRHPPG